MKNKKELLRLKRHRRLRLRIRGTAQRPRLVVRRSLKNLYAHLIDDTANRIILSVSTLDKQMKQKFPCAGNVKAAQCLGEVFAQHAKEKGISQVVFDRAGYLYHGRVQAFAEHARKGGLVF